MYVNYMGLFSTIYLCVCFNDAHTHTQPHSNGLTLCQDHIDSDIISIGNLFPKHVTRVSSLTMLNCFIVFLVLKDLRQNN